MSEGDKARKQKRKNIILSAVMLFILVGGTIGYAFFESGTDTNESGDNGVDNYGDGWATEFQGRNIYFSNSPIDAENISVDISRNIVDYQGKILYIDSENGAVTSEIASTLGLFSSRVQEACSGPCSRDLPEKSCDENIIVWKDSVENRISEKDNCVIIEGDLKTVDAFLFKIFQFDN